MSKIIDILSSFSADSFVSGDEKTKDFIASKFPYENAYIDKVGNLILTKLSGKIGAKKIMIDAHIDCIGFCVNRITKEGFISVDFCGGFDKEIVPGTEFFIFGKKKVKGIACSIPPHLKNTASEDEKSDLQIYIDCGFSSKKEAEKLISLGDSIMFSDPCERLLNGKIVSPYLDNRASIAALLLSYENAISEHDLYYVFSVGEETTFRGAKYAADAIKPDIALVVDVGFALSPELDKTKCIKMGKGPSISYTDTLSYDMSEWVKLIAEKNSLDLQLICEAGGTGTNATSLQLQNSGVPSCVISIPLKNMHTNSEIVDESDIEKTADLLCAIVKEKNFPCQEVILVERN